MRPGGGGGGVVMSMTDYNPKCPLKVYYSACWLVSRLVVLLLLAHRKPNMSVKTCTSGMHFDNGRKLASSVTDLRAYYDR